MAKTIHVGPSWTEVFLGAFLALALGIALGALSLMLKPVLTVKELPKEADRVASAVYYIEGSRDGNKGSQAETKRKNFAAGQSVSVTADGAISFVGLPPGYSIESCQGYAATPVPTARRTWGAVKRLYR